MIGERYLPFIENVKIGDVSLQLMVISDDPDLEKKLKELFPGKKLSSMSSLRNNSKYRHHLPLLSLRRSIS